MPNMPASLAARAVSLAVLVSLLATPAQAEDSCVEPCDDGSGSEGSPPESGNQTTQPCTSGNSTSCSVQVTLEPVPVTVESGPICRPVEFTGGKPRVQLYPILNVVAINWCLAGALGTTIHPPL